LGVDIITATITTIEATFSIVVSVITVVVSDPLGKFTSSVDWSLSGCWGSSSWSRSGSLKAFASSTILGVDIITTTISTIKVAISIVVFVVAEVISNPVRASAAAWWGSGGGAWWARWTGWVSTATFHVGSDPGKILSDSSVDSRVISQSTSNTKADHTSDDRLATLHADEWAARVSLAGILASGGKTSADHVGGDAIAVSIVARSLGHDRYANPLELLGQRLGSGLKGSPSRDPAWGTISRGKVVAGQANGLNISSQSQRSGQFQDSNIVIHGLLVPVAVDDIGDLNVLSIVPVDVSDHDVVAG